jgi:hypothetical protein
MAFEQTDQSVPSDTDSLVKEEERLYGRSELTDDDRRRLSELKVELDQYGNLLRSAGHCANSGMTLTRRKYVPPT